MSDKLKPCPFCGGEAEVEQMGSGRQSMIIACTQCGCRQESSDTFLGPHCSWNTRELSDARSERLKKLLRECQVADRNSRFPLKLDHALIDAELG